MGSRKKKVTTQKIFLEDYLKLGINERIAFKAWAWWYGRQRFTLVELIKRNHKVEQWRNWN